MQKLEGIKNIIFDLGNVLIPLRPDEATEAFQRIMLNDKNTPDIFTFKNLDLFTYYETGKISTSEFLNLLKPYFNTGVTNKEIIKAWNTVLGDFPKSHVEMLKKLAPRYRLFVLSNTNEIHTAKFEKEVPQVEHLKDLFEKLYYSHLEGLRKPQPEIYKRVIEQNQLIPSETLFADDLEENLEPARQLGIRTLHVNPQMDLHSWFATE